MRATAQPTRATRHPHGNTQHADRATLLRDRTRPHLSSADAGRCHTPLLSRHACGSAICGGVAAHALPAPGSMTPLVAATPILPPACNPDRRTPLADEPEPPSTGRHFPPVRSARRSATPRLAPTAAVAGCVAPAVAYGQTTWPPPPASAARRPALGCPPRRRAAAEPPLPETRPSTAVLLGVPRTAADSSPPNINAVKDGVPPTRGLAGGPYGACGTVRSAAAGRPHKRWGVVPTAPLC